MHVVKELWEYREMTANLVKRDLKSRYKGSVLGFFWMFLNPLLQLAVYTVVFSTIMKMGIDRFYLFMFVAFVPWLFFSTCLSSGTTVVFAQQDIVKKIYFPREVLPLAFTLSQFINMLLSFLVIFAVVAVSGVVINPLALFWLAPVMLVEFVLALGTTLLVSALSVYFRDMEHMMGILSMAWMYLTPVIYPVDMVPEQYQHLLYFNPMTSITVAYRDILYYATAPQAETLLHAAVCAGVVLAGGQAVFCRLKRHFAEEL